MAKRKNSGTGPYTSNNAGLTKQDWTERRGELPAKRDILGNVEKKQAVKGGYQGPVKFGVDE